MNRTTTTTIILRNTKRWSSSGLDGVPIQRGIESPPVRRKTEWWPGIVIGGQLATTAERGGELSQISSR